ncbi:MAG: hypothetical protein GW802_27380, partial [Armatimonadetes bacterium]|nr:hypothetical protein [Armatimonadota bacterium]
DPIADVLIGDSGAGALAPETPTQSVTVALDTSKDGSGNVGTAPVDSPTVAPGIKKYLLVLYDIASKADTGSTVGCEIPDTGVKVVSPGVVSGTFPLSTRTVAIADLPDLLTVQGTHLGPATAVQGKTGVVMAKLTLGIRGNDDSVTVTSVRVDQSGTAADSDVARVLLYDAGSNGTFDDPNDPATTTPDTLLAQGQFVGGTISFALALTKQVVVTTTRELLVVFDVADNAPPGATLAVSVVDASYFTVNAPDSVSPNTFPLATTPTTEIVSKSITLNVAGQNLAPATVKQGSRAAFLSLSVWTQTGTCRLDSVKVKRTGAGTDADVSLVMLYADSGSVANQLDVGDTLLAQGTLDPAAHAVDLQLDPPVSTYPTGYQVTSSQQRLLIVFDLAALAVVRTDAVGAEVAEAANVVASVSGSTVTTNSANFPLDSYNPTNPATRTDIAAGPTTLTVEGYSVAPDQAPQGSAVAMLMLRLIKYGAIAETVTSLTVDKLGTATASNVAGVDLYDDTNHNSVWDAGDTKVNVQSGQFGSPATIAGLAYAVNSSDGVFEQLFVVLKIADVANIGATVGVTLTDKTFVTLQGQAQPGDG